jgi:cellulose synthase (UDP-forming)
LYFWIFPVVAAITAALLIGFGYRRPGEINRVFADYLRPPRLKRTIAFWMAGIAAVFLFVQWLRYPYYAEFAARLVRLQLGRNSVGEVLTVCGMGIALLCELLVITHWSVYLVYCWIGVTRFHQPQAKPLAGKFPKVVVLITSCNEEPEVLRRSLSTVNGMRYPNKQIFLLENSRDLGLKAHAAQLAGEYGIEVLHIRNRGHKAGAMNDALAQLDSDAPYLAVIDADQRVEPEFLEEIVPLLEEDAKLAFVQTSQLYENADETWLCRAAAQQETLLYDTIMEAKGALNRALCCGTNFVMRMAALKDVGGWDERTVSEDLCTSYLLHRHGWKSQYVRKAYGWGLGPINLAGYWKQQRRWASGNTAVAHLVLKDYFSRKPARLSFRLAAEYMWSAGYYITALALAVLATLPMLLMASSYVQTPQLFQPRGEILRPEWLFLSVYPLYAMVMLFPYVNMRLRGYPVRNLVMLQGLLAITIPVYLQSALRGFFQGSTFFEIAPKKLVVERIRLWTTPQTYVMAGMLITGSWLTQTVAHNLLSSVAWIALFWTFLYTLSFGHFFIFAVENRRLLKRLSSAAKTSTAEMNTESNASLQAATLNVEEPTAR